MNIQNEIGTWQRDTFPSSTTLSKIKHLRHEIDELEEDVKNGTKESLAMELADCAFFLFGIADLNDIDLMEAVKKKFEINRQRKWGNPDKDGVVFHIKED